MPTSQPTILKEGGDGVGMSNEVAANCLSVLASPLNRRVDEHERVALKMGAAALREVGPLKEKLAELERWAEAHIKRLENSGEHYYIGVRDGLIMTVDALNGEMDRLGGEDGSK